MGGVAPLVDSMFQRQVDDDPKPGGTLDRSAEDVDGKSKGEKLAVLSLPPVSSAINARCGSRGCSCCCRRGRVSHNAMLYPVSWRRELL